MAPSTGEQDDHSDAIRIAIDLHRSGRFGEAEAVYRRVLAAEPNHFDALHLLGVIAHQNRRYADAIESISKAVALDASAYPAFNNLGLAFQAAGNLREAERCFTQSVSLNENYSDAQFNLALLQHRQGRSSEAAVGFRRVLAQRPEFAEAHHNLGAALQSAREWDAAIASYRQALTLQPELAEAHFNLARALEATGKTGEALAEYQEVLLLQPEMAEAHFFVGSILQDQGMLADALECFATALSLKPEYAEARWAHAMSQLALVYGAEDDQKTFTDAFSTALIELEAWFNPERIADGYKAVGSQQPFFLAYVEGNNEPLLSRYGNLCRRLMAHWESQQGIAIAVPARDNKLRLGIVSAHVHDQSVWTAIVRGWCEHLDAGRISLHIFHTGTPKDDETTYAQSRAAYFTHGTRGLTEWARAVVDRKLDAIIYPEIGMDPMTAKLANLRLAPVQIAAWGHPETTGFPTIDYYLSAEDFEPPNAQKNYREKLVTLPRLGCAYRPLNVEAIDLDCDALGLNLELPILICAGAPMKYAPDHDAVFVKIAQQLGRCQFVFFNHFKENLSAKLQRRLDAAFLDADMYFSEYAVYLPWLKRPAFFGLMRRADVYLDTIGFSGFNTAMQAVECDLPIVAWEGYFMRGRLASGILKRMGLSELVARTESEYVALVVKLVEDDAYRLQVRERAMQARDALFNDVATIRALEGFLERATQAARQHDVA